MLEASWMIYCRQLASRRKVKFIHPYNGQRWRFRHQLFIHKQRIRCSKLQVLDWTRWPAPWHHATHECFVPETDRDYTQIPPLVLDLRRSFYGIFIRSMHHAAEWYTSVHYICHYLVIAFLQHVITTLKVETIFTLFWQHIHSFSCSVTDKVSTTINASPINLPWTIIYTWAANHYNGRGNHGTSLLKGCPYNIYLTKYAPPDTYYRFSAPDHYLIFHSQVSIIFLQIPWSIPSEIILLRHLQDEFSSSHSESSVTPMYRIITTSLRLTSHLHIYCENKALFKTTLLQILSVAFYSHISYLAFFSPCNTQLQMFHGDLFLQSSQSLTLVPSQSYLSNPQAPQLHTNWPFVKLIII